MALGQRRARLTPEASPRHLFGYELRSWRDKNGLSLAQLAGRVYHDAAHLGKAERGERLLRWDIAKACDTELGADGALIRLWSVAAASKGDEAKEPADEAKATVPLAVEEDEPAGSEGGDGLPHMIIPAITDDGRTIYVRITRRNALSTIGGVALGAAVSLMPHPELRERTAFIRSRDGRVDMAFAKCVRETLNSYRRTEDMAGGRHLWPIVHSQLETVNQLLPAASGDVADQLLSISAEHAHWLSWVAAGEAQMGAALGWLDLAHGWASEAGNTKLVSWVARVRSTYALDNSHPTRALRLAEQARQNVTAKESPAAASIAAHAEGMAAAALGQLDRARRAADDAYALGKKVPEESDRPGWLYWLDPVRVELHRADTAFAIKDWPDAISLYKSNVESLRNYPRDHAYYEARLQEAQARK